MVGSFLARFCLIARSCLHKNSFLSGAVFSLIKGTLVLVIYEDIEQSFFFFKFVTTRKFLQIAQANNAFLLAFFVLEVYLEVLSSE